MIFTQCPAKLELYLYAYDNNMHYADKNFRALETVANAELRKRYDWYKFTSNKLTLRTPSSLLAEVSHDEAKMRERRETLSLIHI